MISTIKEYGSTYRCSNCQMTQYEFKPNCPWCNSQFSNYETMLIKYLIEKEVQKNESNLSRNYMAEEGTL